MKLITFGSDNNAGVHPAVMEAILAANREQFPAYGDDPYSLDAVAKFREQFGPEVEVFFVFTGTAANVLSLQTVCRPYHVVICATTAHINTHECGAPEKHTGCKLIAVPTPDGKLTVDLIRNLPGEAGNQHAVQPRVVSITEGTELGTVYTQTEIRELTAWTHEHNLFVHMDGARVVNAAAYLNCGLREITGDAGVDLLSFGGTKNGMMFGEAVVIFRPELARDFLFIRKQGMQLMSKMCYAAVQFTAIFTGDLWRKNAVRANELAQLFAAELQKFPEIRITQKVETNAVFAEIPHQYLPKLKEKFFFYLWDEKTGEARLMTSFETKEEEIREFIGTLKECRM